MALTPAQEAELRLLQREVQQEDDAQNGDNAMSVLRSHLYNTVAAPVPQHRDFSIYRVTVGATRDAAQGILDTSHDISHWSYGVFHNTFGLGDTASHVLSGDWFLPWVGSVFGSNEQRPDGTQALTLPHLKGEEDAGTPERIVRGVGSFLIPFVGWSKALGVARAASWLGTAGRSLLAGAATDFTQTDPVSGNLANGLKDLFGLSNPVIDSLAGEQDGDAMVNRFKAAAAGAPLGIASEALFKIGGKMLEGYRAWKGSAEEADAIVKSMKKDIKLDPGARNLPATVEPENPFFKNAANDNGPAGASAKAAPEDAHFTDAPAPEFDPAAHVSKDPPPKDFEDVIDYLKRKADAPEVDAEMVQRVSRNLLFGDPENALAKIGIDPVKLDFSKFDDPDLLGRLQKGMADLYETFASKLGRSNQRVTEEALVGGARAFATTADVLKNLHGNTANLAETLMGARMFVGAHAQKLLALADDAAEEIIKGGAGEAEKAFLESFMRHAYFLGAVRGAGTEVGRALRSLQFLAKPAQKAAADVGKALENEAVSTGRAVQVNKVAEGAEGYLDRWSQMTDAEKLADLGKLKALGTGDISDLTRRVRQANMSILRRVATRLDGALKETTGNLFSVGTATMNAASGGIMLGGRVLERSLATMGRLALAPFGGAEAGVAARMRFADTWAYTHGIMSGFGEASRNLIAVLQKEGMAELAVNADSMGLHSLAKDAVQASNEGVDKLAGRTFERTEVRNFREFAVLPGEMKLVQDAARSLPGPKFFQEGLAALARIVGAGVNLAGSASRAGTILFINLPDEFVGTLASRAGAYSYAVRAAANEAVEHGLDGPAFSQYVKARTIQLAEHPNGWHPDAYDAGVREAMGAHGELEAREVLFQDEGAMSGFASRASQVPLLHLLVPFVKTPLRILERTAMDYTPLAPLKESFRRAIAQGGPARDEAIARLSLGMIALGTAYSLADDRRMVIGNDGGRTSSARLSRPSYSIQIGDDHYEFSRLDPLGTLLGIGADIREFYRSIENDPDQGNAVANATEGFLLALSANMLSKTWLTSLKNLTDLAGATSDEDMRTRMKMMLASFAPRFVPGSGMQRSLEKVGDQSLRQAMTFFDEMRRNSLGEGELPVKRDPLLGRPIPLDGLDRLVGFRAGPGASPLDDPVGAEVERLSFRVPGSSRKVEGVSLTAQQFSRYLELKGQVLKDRTGMTLEQKLGHLIQMPEYRALADPAKVDAIRKEMEGYARLAKQQLVREDHDFARAVLRQETFTKGELSGWNRDQSEAEYTRLGRQLGLIPQ